MNKIIRNIQKIQINLLIEIVLNIYLAYTFLRLWIHPQFSDIDMIYSLTVMILFEFVMVHSGVFMTAFGKSWKAWLFLIIFYGAFALAFNSIVSDNQIIIIYCTVVLNRMLPKILNKGKTDNRKELGISVGYSMIYIILITIVALSSGIIPQFGLTPEFLEVANYNTVNGGIDWEFFDMPYIVMCFGVLYYFALTIVDVALIIRKVKIPLIKDDNKSTKLR